MLIAAFLSTCIALVRPSVPADQFAPDSPLEFGRSQLADVLRGSGLGANAEGIDLRVMPGGAPESFIIRRDGERPVIEGADQAGAMYGALELAERIHLHGAAALKGDAIQGSPFLRDRGLNVFLTLPWDYQKNTTDADPAALTDPNRWWFANDDYWTTLLDLMARARLNWLDMHGMWDINVTDAPNLYAYFVECPTYPRVGVDPRIKAANLARLNKIIDMAHARGIRVSLMAYEAKLHILHNPNPPYPRDEKTAYDYTREAVEQMIRLAPALDAIGFRIGESGHGGEFFNCYIEAVKNSGREIPLVTRSWVTRRSKVLPLAARSSDFTVEIKYNGEQWGPPYPIAGGRVAGWYSYSFEDYLSDPGSGPFSRLWHGNPIGPEVGSGTWPAEPYKIVWQVRLNGTHRIFPFNDPGWVRRSIQSMKLGTASGFTIEPINAYFPASPRYYLANEADRWCDWIHQRDEMFISSWGRYGYDPATPPEVFSSWISDRFGSQARVIEDAWNAASRVIPTAFSAYSLGPDHRNHAPELEWGGDTAAFMDREPFDSHVFMSAKEMLALRATGGIDGRLTPLDAAAMLEDLRDRCKPVATLSMNDFPARWRGQAREIATSTAMLAHLADYYAARLRAAEALARSEASEQEREQALRQTGIYTNQALVAWRGLSDSPEANYYKPFTDRLRLGTNDFHWKNEFPKMVAEAARYPAPEGRTAMPVDGPARTSLPAPALTWTVGEQSITCRIPAAGITRAWLLHKPLPSSTFFHKLPMVQATQGTDAVWIASFARLDAGHAIAAEIEQNGLIRRIPSWDPGPPYLAIPSRPGPTPTYYSSEESLRYLRPEILTPDRYSMMLVCTRAWTSHTQFSLREQRKLMDAVERGLPLLVLQQDYASGRYPLKWLGPEAPKVLPEGDPVFDPAGTLSLPRIEAGGILAQRFAPAPGWEILGNGGIAHATRGKGEIWMVQARLMQRMNIPAAAHALRTLLSMKGTDKPVVIVDAGTEGAHWATSVFADFLNAHDIPFLTLGEVIANQQGADCLTPVPGPLIADDILEGRGLGMMKSYLDQKVRLAARRDVPPTKDAFADRQRKQKTELMRALGLDPLPERTELNPRISGIAKRDGYRIEKLVFDSRPGFPVTALVYVPDGPAGTRFPVIVNPHGHWAHKKAETVVQMRAISQALRGYLAIVVDSPGHSFEGDTRIERRWAGSHDDLSLSLSAGTTTGIYVWDLIRAVDYLETRPDADTTRIGITGTSGGGLATQYAFAADDRFKVAVPVCYATSLEVNPHNGCLCNHVPGTLRIGDRADVLAIRAPAPVMVIGATDDREFPADGTRLTGKKLEALYGAIGAADRTACVLVESGHDYNQPMREAAMGFFDRHLRGVGNGDPITEPQFTPDPDNSPDLFCLSETPAGARTMREIAAERLKVATVRTFEEVLELNGGLPGPSELKATLLPQPLADARRRGITLESEPGMTIPGLLLLPEGQPRAVVVLTSEDGKLAAAHQFDADALLASGIACLCIDVRGVGELAGMDVRLMSYLGTSPALAMGWDAARAAQAIRELSGQLALPLDIRIGIAGRGAVGSQVAMFAALINPAGVSFIAGLDGMKSYSDCFTSSAPMLAIHFRADRSAPLEHLRGLVKQPAVWGFAGEPSERPARVIADLANR
ncbi:MAG: prolyl oligopeptidase family serine peptidase [Phycisphaerales bacterium]|nr:prolyl oligopeptidase family serine peptidase [Phycisphaerales bacterium]